MADPTPTPPSPNPSRQRPLRRKLLWACAVVAALLLLTETTLRIAVRLAGYNLFEEVTVDDPRLGWRLNAGYAREGLRINQAGYRGPDLPADAGDRRIVLCIGDSCTFGAGVRDDETWPARLQERLDDDRLVVNAGVPGYTSTQCRFRLEEDLRRFNPEAVVIQVLWNDLWTYRNPGANTAASPTARAVSRTLSRSMIFVLLRNAVIRPLRARPPSSDGTPDTSAATSRPPPPADPALDVYRENLEGMLRAVRDKGARAILVLPPAASPEAGRSLPPAWTEGRARFDELRRRFEKVLLEAAVSGGDDTVLVVPSPDGDIGPGTPVGPLPLVIPIEPDAGVQPEHFTDTVHLDAEGNRRLAALIEAAIKK